MQVLSSARVLGVVAAAWLVALANGQAVTYRCSEGAAGGAALADSASPAISGDGRFVAFSSLAPNLVVGDSNGDRDVFVFDRATGVMECVTMGLGGSGANGASDLPSISQDGRFVCFVSLATNLVPGDNNYSQDVFVHDRLTGATQRVSVGVGGSDPDRDSDRGAISADGRWVAFGSQATNLVPNDTNGFSDVFVFDRATSQTERVSVGAGGSQGDGPSSSASISADGIRIAFASDARNFSGKTVISTDVYVRDRQTLTTVLISHDALGQARGGITPVISADGSTVAFDAPDALLTADTNSGHDIYAWNFVTAQMRIVSVSSLGDIATGFSVPGSFGVPVAVEADSYGPSISADGRFVSFGSLASNLVNYDTNDGPDAFVHDMLTNQTQRVSVDAAGIQSDASCAWNEILSTLERPVTNVAISADGGHVTYDSPASNLVPGDTNSVADVFAIDLWPHLTAVTSAQVGHVVQLDLTAPPSAGKEYIVGLSGTTGAGTPIDRRRLPVVVDGLLMLSLMAPAPYFVGFSGSLDAFGSAEAYISIPNDPNLAGLMFYASFITIDPAAPSGVDGIANAVVLQVVS